MIFISFGLLLGVQFDVERLVIDSSESLVDL